MSREHERHPFLLSVEEVVRSFRTDVEKGLTSAQVTQLSKEYPENELDVRDTTAWYTILIRQLCNAMILVLLFALALSFGVADYVEGGVLTAVVVLNVSVGFFQEHGAEKKMDALRALSSPSATVVRDGKMQVIPTPKVFPGDIVILKMGDTVPADLRLFDAMNLACDEQSLTGEAAPVEKVTENNILVPGSEKVARTDIEVGVADRVNLAYGTTVVRKGRGRGIVIATGMDTEVGKIAASTSRKRRKPGRSMSFRKYGPRQPIIGLLRRAWDVVGKFLGLTEGTPLQRKLAGLAYVLFGCALILAVVVFAVNSFRVSNEVLIYAISTGIAIVPESLIAVLTISFVVATTVMLKKNVVVRDLSSLEALGGVTNICSDKTGTLTQGAMIVKNAWLPNSQILTVWDSIDPNNPSVGKVTCVQTDAKVLDQRKVDYDSERTAGSVTFDIPEKKLHLPKEYEEPKAQLTPELRAFLLSAALCNIATVRHDEKQKTWQTTGDPTEIALQVFAHRFGMGKKMLEQQGWKELSEFPFDSTIKRMSAIYNAPEGASEVLSNGHSSIVFTKGAVERILDLCVTVGTGDSKEPMTEELKARILGQMTSFASCGQRVLAVAYKQWNGRFPEHQTTASGQAETALRSQVESQLTLLGLAGIYDPPRIETTPAIRECARAGIRVHMLTGDHPETAKAIAKEVGIIPHDLSILPVSVARTCIQKATDFDKLSDAEIDALPELPLVIARCAPETKTKMIEALRRRNAFMAMTGDGVNDAPSLSRADVGIAMGSGSDVAKSAAKIVLTDDKFNSIVDGLREGRRLFDNIQKFVLHLLTSNVGEVILLIAGLGFQDQSGASVFPISPLEILWINMVTSSFPAFGLGREKAGSEVMRKPPHDRKQGVFTTQIIVDMIVYGLLMGTTTLMTFVIVVYGANGGDLGRDCNKDYSESCHTVFRARGAVFVELTWQILVSAWEFKSLRRSLFSLSPGNLHPLPVLRDLWENKFLFWAVALGALSVFPVVYAPVLNTHVFKHVGFGWEWGIVVGFTVVFVAGMELWKTVKRQFSLFEDHAVDAGNWVQGSGEAGKIIGVPSSGSSRSWRNFGKRITAADSMGKGGDAV